jgi:hypothetical protein
MIQNIWFEILARVCYLLSGLLLAIVGVISPRTAEIVITEMGKALRNYK